jgi:hypothetical protein
VGGGVPAIAYRTEESVRRPSTAGLTQIVG